MKKRWIVSRIIVFVCLCGISPAFSDELPQEREKLADEGIEVEFSFTQISQQNLRGGTSTHRRAGRYTGNYDMELTADLEKLLGIERAELYMHLEGGFSDGIDASSVSSVFGVNAKAGGDEGILVSELWYEQDFADESLRLRIGKLDITGGFDCRGCPVAFDGSAYANDETEQFLNGALVNNPTIPFPDKGLGAVLYYNPADKWYVSAGIIDAQADPRETGFNTAFHKEDYFFSVYEAGITPEFDFAKGPLVGAYRAGLWYDPQPKANSDGAKNYRDDVGFYLSCDQMLIRENAEDCQGLGTFFRFGYADSKKNDIANFWSFGFQYEGLFEGRDEDILGIGFAHGTFSDTASTTYNDDYESVVEMYYNAKITPWLSISPDIQYVANPGGVEGRKDVVLIGIRVKMSF